MGGDGLVERKAFTVMEFPQELRGEPGGLSQRYSSGVFQKITR